VVAAGRKGELVVVRHVFRPLASEALRWASPKAAEHAAGDAIRFLLVSEFPKRRPGYAALNEEGAPSTVMCEEPRCPDPLPEIERAGFVLAAPQPRLPHLGALRCQPR